MKTYLNGKVIVKADDITVRPFDAIVNAANRTLMGGGGVDGMIHRKGGPVILEACKKIRETKYPDGLPEGEAVWTLAGHLPAKIVIHTVGPVWQGGSAGEAEKLRNCYLNVLKVAETQGCRSIAIPAISTGAYRFPKEYAAEVASQAIMDYLKLNPLSNIQEIKLVFYSEKDRQTFMRSQKFDPKPKIKEEI